MFEFFKGVNTKAEAINRLNTMEKAFLKDDDFPLQGLILRIISFLSDVISKDNYLDSETLGKAIENAIFMDKTYSGINGGGYPITKTIMALQGINLTESNSRINDIAFLLTLTSIAVGITYDACHKNHMSKAIGSITDRISNFWKNIPALEDDIELDTTKLSLCHRLV